ncbi:hypothetical protein Glove_452g36 [Diversispora epigaea]|uniref:CCHC-type domain-containing protein n=1 Tax=Diversispora epigaea TaxID=1348612 RepID=A0A397GQB4_9GLOM|nr:hypothetical protein Glove_452g36 [Diversispora epigaea]
MVIAKRRNDCVNEAIKQKNEAISEIVEGELFQEEKDPNYEVTYTLKDLNRVKDHLDLIKHHVWIRDNILVDNRRTVFNIPTSSYLTSRTYLLVKDKPLSVTIWCLLAETQKEIILLMVIAKRRNDCVNEAIKQKNEAISEIVEGELFQEEKDPNYEVTYTLKDLNRVKDHLDLIKHHVWIRDNILVDNRRTVFNIPTRRTVQRLTPEEREQRRQRYQQQNQNPVTVRLPTNNSATTSPSATAVSLRQSPEQVTPHFNLLNQQLAEAHLTASDSSDSSDTNTEDKMANADPFQWMLHFEKVAHSNAWNEVKKIHKYATYLEDDAEKWYDEINSQHMANWAAWRAGFVEKYCNTRWKNKWLRELENNRQRQEETIDAYYARFKRLVKRVEIHVDQHKRLFIKGLLPHIAPLVTMQAPTTLATALEKAQAYEEGLDMVNEIEPRKQKGKKKVVESSDEEEEEEEERKLKKTVLKKKKKEAKVTFDPAHNLDDLAKKFEKMQLNLIQKMEKNNNRETRTCFKCGKEGHISWNCPDHKDNSDNFAHAKLVEVEKESEKKEDKLLQHLLNTYDAYLGKRERDDSIPKVVKTEITPKKKSKENAVRPPLFRKKDFDIVEQLQNQPAGLSWADALEVSSIRKSFFEALRKPKEKEIKLADQEYSLKTTALKCNVAVGVYTVPTIVDSGAAISIITRDAMKQLGYEIEEASKSIILPATGKKTQPLGVIHDLPITIQGQTIPINVEVIDAATYSLLLENNWLMKANASYNWSDQELTLRCTNESDTETEESEEDDEEIIFKNTTIEEDDDENDEDTVSVFLSEKLNKNDLDIGQLNNHQQQKFDKLMERNKDLFVNDVSSLG